MIKTADHKYNLTQKELCERLNYDKVSGVFTWKATEKVAGWTQRGHGSYRRILINGRAYLAHRLAWFYVYGKWPEPELDHIDGNGLNNSFSNLRESDRKGNVGNRGPSKNSSSKIKGVHWHKVNKRWIVQMYGKNGKRYIGSYKILNEAKKAYRNAAIKYFGKFARAA